MKKHQFINSRGEVVDLEDNDIVPDGYGVRVSAFLMDGVPQSTDTHLTDALGRPAGHRPGYVFARDGDETAAQSAHAAMVARTSNAWRVTDSDPAWPGPYSRPPAPKPADMGLSTSAAREAYITRVSNAWRTGQVQGDKPAPSAWGGAWVDRNPSPKPPDVGLDAAPNSADVAYQAMVARVSNAWRTR